VAGLAGRPPTFNSDPQSHCNSDPQSHWQCKKASARLDSRSQNLPEQTITVSLHHPRKFFSDVMRRVVAVGAFGAEDRFVSAFQLGCIRDRS
jgi:hypothetical protein